MDFENNIYIGGQNKLLTLDHLSKSNAYTTDTIAVSFSVQDPYNLTSILMGTKHGATEIVRAIGSGYILSNFYDIPNPEANVVFAVSTLNYIVIITSDFERLIYRKGETDLSKIFYCD